MLFTHRATQCQDSNAFCPEPAAETATLRWPADWHGIPEANPLLSKTFEGLLSVARAQYLCATIPFDDAAQQRQSGDPGDRGDPNPIKRPVGQQAQ